MVKFGLRRSRAALKFKGSVVVRFVFDVVAKIDDWQKSNEFMRTSAEFGAWPIGSFVDADATLAARESPPQESYVCGPPTRPQG
jgi:hypothetical protein